MAEHNLYLLLALAVVGPTVAQINWMQTAFANTVSTSLSNSGMDNSFASGMERGAENLRRALLELNDTASSGVSLAQDKVRDWYLPRLASIWRWPVAYAQWLNPDVSDAMCPEDPGLGRLLKEVERDALACVQEKVSRSIPDVHASVSAVLARINQYVQTVRAQGEECDEQVGMQGMMCKATRLAPMGGTLGFLGGDVGRVGGHIGVLVDGNARQCTLQAAQPREAQASGFASAVAECTKAQGGNAGNAETARYFTNWRNSNNLVVIR